MYEKHQHWQQRQEPEQQLARYHDIVIDENSSNMRLAKEAQAVESAEEARRIIEKYHLLIDS
jgi:hypothetical protein